MGKKKLAPRTAQERMAALAERAQLAAGELELAAKALALAQPREDDVGYLERCFDRVSHDVRRFREDSVLLANLPPDSRTTDLRYNTPDELKTAITGALHEPRPQSHEDHANPIYCRVMHRELPEQFSDAWDAWKARSQEILEQCPGQRDALGQRIQRAQTDAAILREKHALEVTVTPFGELVIPRDFDPWPQVRVGDLDENRMAIVTRAVWGYEPTDRPPRREWTFDDDEYHEVYEYGAYDESGNPEQIDSEYYCGLMLMRRRVYKPPGENEHVTLEHVPHEHWYKDGRSFKQRTGDEPRAALCKLVLYAGSERPQEQLELLAAVSG